MKKKETFLQLHDRLLSTGVRMRNGTPNGLCYVSMNDCYLMSNETFALFIPEPGYGQFWASDSNQSSDDLHYGPTRQNIILLCAALNGEL